MLRHADERNVVPVERLHHLGEVEQRSAEPVHLVHDDAVDLAGLDVGQQAFERRPVHVAAGETAVVVAVGERRSTFMCWLLMYASPDSRWASSELNSCSSPSSVDFAGVDGAANLLAPSLIGFESWPWSFGAPLPAEAEEVVAVAMGDPVIFLATALSDL